MRITKLWLLPIALVALALVIAGCTKDGDPIKGNVAPDTRILSYVISSAAELDTLGDPTTNYSVTIYWAGSDIDGTVKSFLYSDDAGNSGETINSQKSFVYDFANAATEYTMQVQARDNLNVLDRTAAEITVIRNAGGVETAILDGPPHGAEVSSGVRYKAGASSGTGTITAIEHRVNDGPWTSAAADENGEALIEFLGLPGGSSILSFKGVRDDGVEDATPASISLLVRDGQFAPVLESTSPVVDGGGWFEGVTLTFSWTVSMAHYYGVIQDEGYSWAVGPDLTPPDNYNLDPDAALGDGWSSATSADYDPIEGTHAFYLKCRDTDGGVDTLRIRFS
ncbi:MAG: hypothetical protein KAJ16_01445, partial [Calditrichia bacterium]|nr:hypothetical protein [Calditrichia bacterium]